MTYAAATYATATYAGAAEQAETITPAGQKPGPLYLHVLPHRLTVRKIEVTS